MSTTPKIFGQSKPTDTINDNLLYRVPVSKQAQVTVFVANQDPNPEAFRIALIPSASLPATAPNTLQANVVNYISYDTALIGNGVFAVSSIGLNSGDAIYVKSQNGNISFVATGIEFA